tara:strand:- start:1524 stop:2801 length:1278 start_codon:yes stop_codon:yes gene_type:complete
MFRLIGVLIALITLVHLNHGHVRADFDREDWEFYKSLSLPVDMEVKEFVEVYPDADLYANSKSNFEDLRIIESQNNKETPYKLVVTEGADTNQELDANFVGLGFIAEKGTGFTAHLIDENSLHNQVEIITDSEEFLVSVKVEASFDGKSWDLLREPVSLYKLNHVEPGNGPSNVMIDYSENSAPFIRVVVVDVNLGELKIHDAKITMRNMIEADYIEYGYSALSRSFVGDSRDNSLVIDMGVVGLPTSRIEFELEETNFYRDVGLEGSDDGETWLSLMGDFVLSSYDTPKLVSRNMIIDYPEIANRYIRVRIVNQDNSPLDIKDIQIYGYSRTLIMEAHKRHDYLVYYGNSRALAPSYDLENMYPYLDMRELRNAQIGMQSRNLSFKPNWYDRYPWLVTFVVVVSTLILGVFLLRIARDVVRRGS